MLPLVMMTLSSYFHSYELKNPVTGLFCPPNKCLIKYVIDKLAQSQKGKTHHTWVLIALVARWETDGKK